MINHKFMFQWIECNLNKKITVPELAGIAGCSERYLRVFFEKNIEMTPSEYVCKRKLTQAEFMLRETSRPITDISLMFGFDNQSTFTRNFKNFTGKSPRDYRYAEFRDMKYFCPSAIIENIPCMVEYVYFNKINISFYKHSKFSIKFGVNFILNTVNGFITPAKSLLAYIVKFIFDSKESNIKTICGELMPGVNCDTILNLYAGNDGEVINNENNPLTVDKGDYICFTFSGTPEELMYYHSWVRGHGLHKYRIMLRNGITLSSFCKSIEPDIYISRYYIPCYKVCHT